MGSWKYIFLNQVPLWLLFKQIAQYFGLNTNILQGPRRVSNNWCINRGRLRSTTKQRKKGTSDTGAVGRQKTWSWCKPSFLQAQKGEGKKGEKGREPYPLPLIPLPFFPVLPLTTKGLWDREKPLQMAMFSAVVGSFIIYIVQCCPLKLAAFVVVCLRRIKKVEIAEQRWLVLFVVKNRLPLLAKLHSNQALWVYSRENFCQIMMNPDLKDTMNTSIHRLKVNTNVQSVFLAWENQCRRAADTDSVEVAFCVL